MSVIDCWEGLSGDRDYRFDIQAKLTGGVWIVSFGRMKHKAKNLDIALAGLLKKMILDLKKHKYIPPEDPAPEEDLFVRFEGLSLVKSE